MSAKENWLIAWSICRMYNTMLTKPRTHRQMKSWLVLAKKCLDKREDVHYLFNRKLECYLLKKGFKIQWTGWKYTWVQIEESDVDF